VDAKADAAPAGATNREMRRPTTDSLEAFFMSETTQIHPDKVRAYLATGYRLGHTEHNIILNIGERSARLAALFCFTLALDLKRLAATVGAELFNKPCRQKDFYKHFENSCWPSQYQHDCCIPLQQP